MNIIEWSENLSIGRYAIDEQHKELINLINNVAEIIKQKDYTFSNIVFVVNKLDDYVDKHFKYEEIIMDECSFPGKKEHVKEHDLARKKMNEINIFDQESFKEEFLSNTLNWLFLWLVNHIMNTDKKLEPYL